MVVERALSLRNYSRRSMFSGSSCKPRVFGGKALSQTNSRTLGEINARYIGKPHTNALALNGLVFGLSSSSSFDKEREFQLTFLNACNGGLREVRYEAPMLIQVSHVPEAILQEIFSYQRPDNYYGEGSTATSSNDCKVAVKFLTFAKSQNPDIEMPSSISPSVDGGIALYWEKNYCQLFVTLSDTSQSDISYQYISPDGAFSVGTCNQRGIVEKLSTIYSR